MKMDLITTKFDEYYTPEYAIQPLLKYVPISWTIWCPFDTEQSNFVKLFSLRGNTVIYTHKDGGKDFFNENIDCDCIVSNPPYSKKGQVFDRLFNIEKPFAMLVGVVGLFESQYRFSLFSQHKFEIMFFDKRISYFRNYDDQTPDINPPFSSVFISQNLLPDRIIFEQVNKKGKK